MKGVAKMDEAQSEKKQEIKRILTEEMWPNPDQPRKNSWGDIQGLRTTMDEQGLVQYPVVIPKKQPRSKGKFMIISR